MVKISNFTNAVYVIHRVRTQLRLLKVSISAMEIKRIYYSLTCSKSAPRYITSFVLEIIFITRVIKRSQKNKGIYFEGYEVIEEQG